MLARNDATLLLIMPKLQILLDKGNVTFNKYMLLAGWEVRIGKNCDRGLENAARGPGRGQHFQARGHSFSLYGPTLRRPITFLSFSSCRKLAYNWVCLRNFAIESAYAPSTNHSQKIKRANERVNQILYEERRIEGQIYFELVYFSAFSSLVKVSKTVFPV